MIRISLPFAVSLGLLLMSGCSSSEPALVRYDTQSDIRTFETERIRVGTFGSGMSSGKTIRMQVIARCRSARCIPDQGVLVFYVENTTHGGSDLSIAARSITIETDQLLMEWQDGELRRAGDNGGISGAIAGTSMLNTGTGASGELMRVAVSKPILTELAYSDRMRGEMDAFSFSLSKSQREPIRTLLRLMSTSGNESPAPGDR